jgi:hypothetical protein
LAAAQRFEVIRSRPAPVNPIEEQLDMMQAMLRAATFALLWTAILCAPAPAQISPEFSNNKLEYAYVPPKSLKYRPLVDRLKQFRMLEQLAEFLSPLRLPHKYTLLAHECGFINAFYQPGKWNIHLCYEFIEMLERMGPRKGQASDFTYEEAVVGAFVGVMLHENGHAVFDMFDVPVFGREEDAADEISTYIALQFNPDVARKVVRGFAYMSKVYFAQYAPRFSDEHGTGLQRYYNTLCIAYGSDYSALFKEFVDQGELPKERAANCRHEYEQINAAFQKTLLPFIDQDLMKKVQARQWLKVTPQQAGLLNQQQQQQTDLFTLALCNRSAVNNVHVALAGQFGDDPQHLEALGWFAVPDGGCNLVGTLRGTQFYWYAEGINNNRRRVWSAPNNEPTALKQCIDPVNAFQLPASSRCQSRQKLVNFRRWKLDLSRPNTTIALQ